MNTKLSTHAICFIAGRRGAKKTGDRVRLFIETFSASGIVLTCATSLSLSMTFVTFSPADCNIRRLQFWWWWWWWQCCTRFHFWRITGYRWCCFCDGIIDLRWWQRGQCDSRCKRYFWCCTFRRRNLSFWRNCTFGRTNTTAIWGSSIVACCIYVARETAAVGQYNGTSWLWNGGWRWRWRCPNT